MKRETPKNLPASVRQRLLNLAQARGEDFGLVLTRYGIERFLFLVPPLQAAKEREHFTQSWPKGGPWQRLKRLELPCP